MIFVVTHFETNQLARTQFAAKCLRALSRRPSFANRVFDHPRPVSAGGQATVAITVDRGRFDRVIQATCRALFYHHHDRKLIDDLLVWSPAFHGPDLRPDQDEAALTVAVEQVLRDLPKVGHNPEVFWYQLFHDPAQLTALRVMFYEGFSAYAVADHRLPDRGSLTSA